MPSDLSYWLISVPLHDGDPASVLADVRNATGGQVTCGGWEIPDLKVRAVRPPASGACGRSVPPSVLAHSSWNSAFELTNRPVPSRR